jgi:hypothetical protein
MTFLNSKNFLSIHGRIFGLFRGLISLGDAFLGGDNFHGVLESTADGLVATGTNQATALQLSAVLNRFSTVAASTGAMLPVSQPGMTIEVINDGAQTLTVFPSNSANEVAAPTIDGVAAATGVSVSSARRSMFKCTTAGTWFSYGVAKST